MAISNIPRSVGHNFLPEYQLSGVPFSRGTSQAERIVVDANGAIVLGADPDNPGGNDVIYRLTFPKITSTIHFKAGAEAANVYFSKKDAADNTTSNALSIDAGESTFHYEIRCTALYFNTLPADVNELRVNAGLTTIDSVEFNETVETFLGDN